MAEFLRSGLDFLAPPRCPLCFCDVSSSPEDGTALFCPDCRLGLTESAGGNQCERCAAPVGPYAETSRCTHCARDRFAFEGVFRLGVYDNLLRGACLQGKQRGSEGLLAALADLTWEHVGERLSRTGVELVVAVPHHWSQRLLRPHNPPETLADVWSRRLNVPCESPILWKTRKTRPQLGLSPQRRRINLRNAFVVREPAVVAGATVLLVDDVLTTGATAHEAARALKRAGAQRVVVAVLARGLGRR